MNTPEELYKELASDFNTEKQYFFADRGEGMMQGWERDGRRIFLVNTEKEVAFELVNVVGSFSRWNISAVEVASVLDMPAHIQRSIISTKVDYYFGVDDFKDGFALVVWTIQPDGQYFADSDGFGMTHDQELNLYAYIDKNATFLVPFQPMDEDIKKRYRQQCLDIISNPDTIPYVALSPDITVPDEELTNLEVHRDTLRKIVYGMMVQLDGLILAKNPYDMVDDLYAITSTVNPNPMWSIQYALVAKEIGEDTYEFSSITMEYHHGKAPEGIRTPFGEMSSQDISSIMSMVDSIEVFLNDLIDSVGMITSGNIPKYE